LEEQDEDGAFSQVYSMVSGGAPGPGHILFQQLVSHPNGIQGKSPNVYKDMANVLNMTSPLPNLNGQQICRLHQYLQQNGSYQMIPTKGDGDCMFGAYRRGTALPKEVADVHVRRQIIKVLCDFPGFFNDLLKHSLALTYGHIRDLQMSCRGRLIEEKFLLKILGTKECLDHFLILLMSDTFLKAALMVIYMLFL